MKCSYCGQCGQLVEEGRVFCGTCGAKNNSNNTVAPVNQNNMNNTVAPVNQNNLNSTDASVNKNESLNKKKKKKKPNGCCGCLIFVILFFLIIFGIFKGIKWYKNYSFEKLVKETALVGEKIDATLTEEEKYQDWNNDGISNIEAQKLGLNIFVSDSDEDGISDYDEINIHKSDPLKYSTMDDIYSDGYKLVNNMEILKKYETFKIVETSVPNLKLEIDDAHDMSYVYKEYTSPVPSGYYLGFQAFRLFSYSGKVNLELEDADNFDVLTFDILTYEVDEIKSKVEDNTLIFEVENDNPIMIVYKKSVIKKMDENLLGKIEDKFHNNRKKEFYVVIVPLVTKILNHPVYVLEVDNSITKGGSDIEFQNKFNKKAANKFRIEHYYTNNFGIKIISSMFGQVKNEIYKNVGEENKGFIDYFIIFKKVGSEDELYNYLLAEVVDGDGEIEEEPEEPEEPIYDTTDPFAEKYNNKKGDYYADSGFNVGVHAFNFENLSTKVSSGGVCAGFSFVTTNIFNNGTKVKRELPSKYNMNSSDYDVIWNGNLYNYQPSSPGLKTYADLEKNQELLNSSIMSKPDSEVVKLLEHYFIEYNDKVRMTKLEWALNKSKKKTYISEKTIKNLVEEFKSGKIVSVNLLSDDGQHAVNAYRIVEDENNPDILYLKVYDNNFPYDMYWHPNKKGKVKYDVTIVLKRIYENTAFGEKIKYSYAYNPINSSNYVYGTDRYCFDGIVFIDENYNTI